MTTSVNNVAKVTRPLFAGTVPPPAEVKGKSGKLPVFEVMYRQSVT